MLLRKNVFQLCHDKRKQNSEISYTSLVIESHSWGTVRLESRNGSLGGFHPALPCSAADFDGRHSFDSRTFAHVHNWNEYVLVKVIISIKNVLSVSIRTFSFSSGRNRTN